ncbi:hypothetical protein [Kordiimonas aquimaris]|uniref:hypothetical protein n=1 Tax=Kordiimonas aquimaris TaxID=707591 RepID=UPI0021D14C5F|nr:hypothetical protein [Kordiimonas aquimaris]
MNYHTTSSFSFSAMMKVLIISVLGLSSAEAETNQQPNSGVVLDANEDLDQEQLNLLVRDIEHAKRRVITYLNNAEIYGSVYKDKEINIIVSNEFRFPYQEGHKIYLPQSRIENLLSGSCETKNCSLAVTHELTHIFAKSAYRDNKDIMFGGRFFDDGLAVFIQHKLGLRPSYPNFGEGLHITVAKLMKERDLVPLADAEYVRNTTKDNTLRRLAYLQEGSFTEFLIETYGLNQYLKVYFGDNPKKIMGYDMVALEQQWKSFIQEL